MRKLLLITFVTLACAYRANALTLSINALTYRLVTYLPMQIFLTCNFVINHLSMPVMENFVNMTVEFFNLNQDTMPDFISFFELLVQIWVQMSEMEIAGSAILANSCYQFALLLQNGSSFLN